MTTAKKTKTHGSTASGRPIMDDLAEELAKKAAAGYDVDETLGRRPTRPVSRSGPADVKSARTAPEERLDEQRP
jgi:hypothetical protein